VNVVSSRFSWELDKVFVFGVLNLTPDSFSDGGAHSTTDAALAHARAMIADGADVIDVGGESTRPRGSVYGDGYRTLDASEEVARIADVVRSLEALGTPFSIDTTKPEVARFALSHGAVVVNDTSNGASDELLREVASSGAGLVLMHNRGRGEIDGDAVRYGDVTADVIAELSEATDRSLRAGVPESAIAWDPGLGFAKSADDSLQVLAELSRIVEIGYPVYVGASRKSFLAAHTARGGLRQGPNRRLGASVAACLYAAERGARAVRVHDVEESVQALALARLLWRPS